MITTCTVARPWSVIIINISKILSECSGMFNGYMRVASIRLDNAFKSPHKIAEQVDWNKLKSKADGCHMRC
jgi:hypothetical protein